MCNPEPVDLSLAEIGDGNSLYFFEGVLSGTLDHHYWVPELPVAISPPLESETLP